MLDRWTADAMVEAMESPKGSGPVFSMSPAVPSGPPRVCGTAVASLVSVLFIPLLPFVLGILALRDIHRSGGRLKGSGLAWTAMVLEAAKLLLLFGLTTPSPLRHLKSVDRAEAMNDMKQAGLALASFEEEYGTFPSMQIYRDNTNQFKFVTEGETANDLLGLLLAGGFSDTEEIFFARGGARITKRPDNRFNAPEKLLEPGECGFGYVMLQGGRALSSKTDNGACPLLVAPLMPGSGGADPQFNPEPYEGQAIYLRIDQSVGQGAIDESGKVPIPEGHTLFETGPGTVWGKDVPDVRTPE